MSEEKENRITQIGYSGIEEEMQKFNPEYKRLSLKEIQSLPPEKYQLFGTLLDDHFTLLLRSGSLDAVKKAQDYLRKQGFPVFGNQDTYGLDRVRNYFLSKNLPLNDVEMILKKTEEYLGIEEKKRQAIGKNKEGDYYFYFLPLKKDVKTYSDFKKGTYLDNLNVFAKDSHQSIDLIFAQLDNVVYGGLKLPGIASTDYYSAFYEAVNVQVLRGDKRNLYIASKVLQELAGEEKEVYELGLFQMFLVDKPIFAIDETEEIYLDFPNEVDESSLK